MSARFQIGDRQKATTKSIMFLVVGFGFVAASKGMCVTFWQQPFDPGSLIADTNINSILIRYILIQASRYRARRREDNNIKLLYD